MFFTVEVVLPLLFCSFIRPKAWLFAVKKGLYYRVFAGYNNQPV